MTRRSEANAVGNDKFRDLPLSGYPEKIDSANESSDGYNPNLKGYFNVGDSNLPRGQRPDYVYAEHINALTDAVMAIQRILGVNPHIDTRGLNLEGTVSDRIELMENMEEYYDKRYGGENWRPELGQTILAHTHGGGTNEAPQIKLESDVSGKLGKDNINLDSNSASGLTGEDIKVAPGRNDNLSEGMEDKLSKEDGGVVLGLTVFNGSLKTNSMIEMSAKDMNNISPLQIEEDSTDGSIRRVVSTSESIVASQSVKNLYPGRYAFGVRFRVNNPSTQKVKLRYVEGSLVQEITLTSDEIKNSNWNMGYLVFNKNTNKKSESKIEIVKMSNSSGGYLDVDNILVVPAHPAIFDK